MKRTKAVIALLGVITANPSDGVAIPRAESLKSAVAPIDAIKINSEWAWAWEHSRTPSHFRWASNGKWYSFSGICCCNRWAIGGEWQRRWRSRYRGGCGAH
jgi:hypothetical protein